MDRLHEQACEVAGNELLDHTKTKPSAFLVAVLWHDMPLPAQDLQRDSFMFVKCNGKTTAGKIRGAYLSREQVPSDVVLYCNSQAPSAATRVSELDHYGDKIVVFHVQSPSSMPEQTANDAAPPSTSTQNGIHPVPEQVRAVKSEYVTPGAAPFAAFGAAREGSHSSRPSIGPSGHPTASSMRAGSLSSMSRYTSSPQHASPYTKTVSRPVSAPYHGTTSAPSAGTAARSAENQALRNAQRPGPGSPWSTQAMGHALSMKREPSAGNASPRAQAFPNSQVPPYAQASGPGRPFMPAHPAYMNPNGYNPLTNQVENAHPEIKPEIPLPAPLPAQQVQDYPMGGVPGDDDQSADGDDDLSQKVISSVHLHALSQEESTEKLEYGVKHGVQLLDRLVQELEPGKETDDVKQWLLQIDMVRHEATRARTVVGVVGNTGAGKSSVINAILDEERLVPTNCMRACTAVIIEMSWNSSNEENSKYRAEIEFIEPAEWEKELKVLFEEVIDSSGNISRETSNPDSQAGIAYAKMCAVYWRHTREDLASSSVEELMVDHSVRNVLGTTRYIKDRYCDTFYKSLQHYVDSKEKPEQKSDSDDEDDEERTKGDNEKKKKKRKREQEFWPLIKVVRLYVKADALSTGAVLVDLPGVTDSNAARAAVAEGYMKQCTGLWIVSPINRAVDDKAAKNLLGQSFRRQLKYDGTYSAVTFICSKTDDISNTEATDSLGLGDEMGELEDRLTAAERRHKESVKEAKRLSDKKRSFRDTMDNCDDDIEKWEALQEKIDNGKTVYAPKPKTLKRKRSSSSTDSDDSSDESSKSNDESDSSDRGPALTADDFEAKLHEMKDRKKEARRARNEIDAEVKAVNAKSKKIAAEIDDIEASRSQICIAARNHYSKSAIQIDFAAGIKELDQEAAAEENPDTFDPEQDLRDYDQVAESLPVYCVSSRAYQKLSGRLVKDNEVRGFTDIDQTEIPALKAHCKKLTENVRAIGCRRFLNSLSRLRNSLSLWASNNGSGAKMTDQQRDAEQRFLSRKLKDLEKALKKDVKKTLTEMKETLKDNIFEHYETAIKNASIAALPTSQRWGDHKDAGGLHWATYKAVVRRQGVYTGSKGLSDFNAELSEPLYKHLASGWEKAFQRRLPHVLKACAKGFASDLRSFHKAVEDHSFSHGGNPRLGMLAQQLNAYEAVFTDLAGKMVDLINERQRDINREFTPNVCTAMLFAYDVCANESGAGSFKRMKEHMNNHVLAQKDAMFQKATQVVRGMLTDMCKLVEERMADRTDQVFVGLRRDYLQVLSNVRVNDITMPKWERSLRSKIEEIIQRSEDAFEAVLDGREVSVFEKEASAGAEDEGAGRLDEKKDDEADEDSEDESKNDTPAKGNVEMEDAQG